MPKRQQRPRRSVTKIDRSDEDAPSFRLLSQAMDLEDVKICIIGALTTADGTPSVSKQVGGRTLCDGEVRDRCACVESLAAAKGHTNPVFSNFLVAKKFDSNVVWRALGSINDLHTESVEIDFASVSVKTCVYPVSHLVISECMDLVPCSYCQCSSSSSSSSISSSITEMPTNS